MFAALKFATAGVVDMLAEGNTLAGTLYLIISGSSTGAKPRVFLRNDANGPLMGSAGTNGTIDLLDNNNRQYTVEDSGNNIKTYNNGILDINLGYSRTGTFSFNRFSVGARVSSSVSNHSTGYLSELIIYPTINENRRTAIINNQKQYLGIS